MFYPDYIFEKKIQNHMLSCDDVTKYVGNWGNLAKNGYFTKFDAEKVRKGFFWFCFQFFHVNMIYNEKILRKVS